MLTELLAAIQGSLDGVKVYRDSIAGLRGINKAINRASVQLNGTLQQFIDHIEKLEAVYTVALRGVEEKLQ